MSIIIRKKETGEVFDVLPDFKLEIKNTSPFFNDLGSKTITTTLPRSPHNIRLFDFAHRIDTTNKARTKIPVIVSVGSYVREGMLYRTTAYNTDGTFGITIAFNEGIMYEDMQDIYLSKLKTLPQEQKTVSEWIDSFNNLLSGEHINESLSIFPIWLKESTYTPEGGTETTHAEIINQIYYDSESKVHLNQRKTTSILNDGKLIEMSVPEGYGITPFVKVWYVLECIFSHYGYSIAKNPFKEHYQLKRLCVLNNMVGSIMQGILDYKQLLPNVTIMDFLQSLYTRFGMRVFFNSNLNEVSLILLKDTLTDTDHNKMSLSSFIDIDEPTPKQIKLSVAKSLDKSSTETETYEEYLVSTNNIIGTYPGQGVWVENGGIYYDNNTGLFIQMSTTNQEEKIVSSIHFDWNKKDEDLEIEEITSIDEAITMTSSNVPYFAVDANFANIVLQFDGVESTSAESTVLAFAYDMGGTYTDSKEYIAHSYGTIFPSVGGSYKPLPIKDQEDNEMQYSLTLIGEYGAFNQFFKEYDAFLRHSNRLVKFTTAVNAFELSQLEFDQQIIVDNQTILLDKVDHDLDSQHIITATIEARTTYLYQPYDLSKEQLLPIAEDILYKWVLSANRDGNIRKERNNLEAQLITQNISFRHKFVALDVSSITKDEDPPSDITFWFLPPNKQQFENSITTGRRKHICSVNYIHHYEVNSVMIGSPNWEPRSETINKEVDYESWFEAEKIE